jgi:hypothetical protein
VYQVVVLPPPGVLGPVEQFRRMHDPAFHRGPAALPLTAPFEAEDAGLLERFDRFVGPRRFDVALGPAQANGRALVLAPSRGGRELDALRRTLTEALFGGDGVEGAAHPTLRVGFFSSEAELELARRSLAISGEVTPFAVTEVTLQMEDERGLWHPVRVRRLRTR